MPGIWENRKREIAILLGALLTVLLYFLIPAVCPGFPSPVVTHIYYANYTTPDGDRVYLMDGRITNEGTRGYVIVSGQLINATNRTPLETSTRTIYLLEREEASVHVQLTGRGTEPYQVRYEVRRR
jgi:hypothetical protein